MEKICMELGVPWIRLGSIEGAGFKFDGLIDLGLAEVADVWHTSLEHMMTQSRPSQP